MSLTWSLCDSATMNNIGVLRNARSRTITEDLNRPGSASFRLPMDDPLATQLDPVRTCLKVSRDGNTVWSGPVWTIQDAADEVMGWTAVGCVGWLEILYHRMLAAPDQRLVLSGESNDMIFSLLSAANAYGPTPPGAASSTYITQGSSESNGVSISRTYDYLTNVGDAIFQLTQIENGVDIRIDPSSRRLNVYALLGSLRDSAGLRLLGMNSNITSVTRNIDASKMANKMWVVGAQQNRGNAEDVISQGTYILLEAQESLSDVSSIDILGAYANAELLTRAYPQVTYDITPTSHTPGQTPLAYTDFSCGDLFTFSVNRGRFKVTNQLARCFGFTLLDGDDGNEKITSIKMVA